MRPRSLLILAIIVALFGAYLYFIERKLPTTDERRAQAKRVLTLDRADVVGVTLRWQDTVVDLARDAADGAEGDDARWHVREPMNAIADGTAVGDLVRDLVELEKSRTVEGIDRSAAGLDPPRMTVTLRHADADATVLEIGAEVPASDAMIVAIAGGQDAYQVPDALWPTLSKAPGEWRDREMFRGTRTDIQQVRLVPTPGPATDQPDDQEPSAGNGAELLLAKRGSDFWLEQPIDDRADRDQVNTMISQLVDLRVTEFLDDPGAAADAGLTPPLGRFEVTLEGRAHPFVVEIGAPAAAEGDVHARVDGQVFTTRADALRSALTRPATAWRSRAWTSWQAFDIDQATIEDEHGTVQLTRADGEWQRDGDTIDFTVASDVLYALGAVRAIEVLDRASVAKEDLAEAAMTLSLAAEDGRTEGLRVYPNASGARLLATTEGRDAVLVLAPDALEDWAAKLAALRAAEPTTEIDAATGVATGVATDDAPGTATANDSAGGPGGHA